LKDAVAAIGPKIRELRRQKNLTLQQLSERSGVSAAAINKIERNGMVPTIATLMKLAGAFNRTVGWLVGEQEDDGRSVVLVRPAERRRVFTSKTGLELMGLSGPYGPFFMAGAAATVEAGADSGPTPMEHAGEEHVYVLDGSLRFTIDDTDYLLRRGDALHFRTDLPHRWSNPGSRPARAIWMALRQP
jgi:transcriptional regulator with XRE-family HTH domain